TPPSNGDTHTLPSGRGVRSRDRTANWIRLLREAIVPAAAAQSGAADTGRRRASVAAPVGSAAARPAPVRVRRPVLRPAAADVRRAAAPLAHPARSDDRS